LLWQPIRKLSVLIGAKPTCPLGQTIRKVWLAERRCSTSELYKCYCRLTCCRKCSTLLVNC
jgi:hypothetical protein